MKLTLGKTFSKKLENRIEGFTFEVGILDDKPHKLAKESGMFETPQLGSYAGGPIRKTTRKESGKSIGDVLIDNMKRLNINLLWAPFQNPDAEINKFTRAFLQMVTRKNMSPKRVENLLQAIVRNPILKQEYGRNKSATADAKGFNRNMIDTGQMFKAIKAKVKRV